LIVFEYEMEIKPRPILKISYTSTQPLNIIQFLIF